MKRVKPQTKRRVAGIVALLLVIAMVLSSVSVIFIDGASAGAYIELIGGIAVWKNYKS